MARFEVRGARLVVRLNAVERLAAWRWRPQAPLSAITSVNVLPSTARSAVDESVSMDVAARGAPLGGIATVGPRARTADGRPAFVVTYLSGQAVPVQFDSSAPWALMLVSSRRARAVAQAVRAALSEPPR